MIGLGEIPVKDGASIVESRNKIRLLAEDLKFGSISAARLTTITSELIRKMIRSGQYSTINVELGLRDNVFGLFLRFTSKQISSAVSIKTLESIFDSVTTSQTEEGLECIDVFKTLPDPEFELTQGFVTEGREIIGRLTRDELYQNVTKRSKELNCLNQASTFMAEVDKSLEEIFLEIVNLIPQGWQYPDITCARIIFNGGRFETDNFNETPWKQSTDSMVAGEKTGSIEVYYLEEKPQDYEGPFLKEERNLIDALAREMGKFIERRQAEENLRKANEKLKEYNQLKDEFVSTASHELRTPLSIIMGAIRLILDEIPGKIVKEQRDVLAMAMENVQRLSRIVSSLLTISKIESGRLDLQKTIVNICELIKDTVSNYEPLAQEKGLRLDCEVPEQSVDICLDPDRTKEVLINLISNSIKFTHEGGRIKVICTEQDKEVLVSVQDSGVGIAKEDIPKLFDKFTQFGRKAGPGEKGTGLGLAIAKKLVEMHGGKIEVESKVNKGTTFTIFLPLTTETKAEGLPVETDELVESTLANN